MALCFSGLLSLGLTLMAGDAPKRLKVVASFLPAYCFAANVASGVADVENLLVGAVSPHEFQLSSGDIRRLEQADLLVVNGLQLEEWLVKLVDRLPAKKRPAIVACSDGLEAELIFSLGGASHHAHHPGEPKGSKELGKHAHGERSANPHIWLDPRLARHAVSNITAALVALDKAGAARYRANSEAYGLVLSQLDVELEGALKGLRSRAFVTLHDAFPYFVRRYGLRLTGVLEEVPEVPPSPKYLSGLVKRMRSENARVIFTEPGNTRNLARQLGADMGLPVAELDTLETGPLDRAGYEKGMRRNVEILKRYLVP